MNRFGVTVDIVIPARNEEDCIGRCLASLTSQQGIDFGITVVDDASMDRTRAIAESFPGVRVISAGEPAEVVSGKCNALIAGACGSAAKWLLFTDADTEHYPGSLAAAVAEAEAHAVDLLSYSPEQETSSFAESALMPLVYAELTRTYPTERVNDPADPVAAANGQYILVRRALYEALGGHKAVSTKILEDVELARIFKVSGHKILFRHGAGRVRTRMYRSFHSMCEGWTKNLAILFPRPLSLAVARSLEFVGIGFLAAAALILGLLGNFRDGFLPAILAFIFYLAFLQRIRQAHFPWKANLLSFLGLPVFVLLLERSYLHIYRHGAVTWKGRIYRHAEPDSPGNTSTQKEGS